MAESITVNEDSELQIQAYLRFAKGKREENVREVELAFSDVREYKLLDSVYTKDDVRTMVDEMNEEVKTTVEKELENNTYVAAAMLKMLLSQAEEAGCAPLSIDTNKLEDMKLLQDVKAIEKYDPRVKEENEQLKREIANLRDKFVKLQGQSIDVVKEKNNFRQGRLFTHNTFSLNLSAFETAQGGADDVAALRADLSAARKEAAGRLQESSQFQQMKKMMMQKTKELQAARKKLSKYESENESDVKSADFDDDEFNV